MCHSPIFTAAHNITPPVHQLLAADNGSAQFFVMYTHRRTLFARLSPPAGPAFGLIQRSGATLSPANQGGG